MKVTKNFSAQSAEFQAANIDSAPGLRERQKVARYERILASARSLFNSRDFDNTTMAAIAENAEVSTPTVFNYFKTKDQLLLALVLQVHHETREGVQSFQTQASSSLPDAICEFLAMYSKTSLSTINRKTWRHVESTSIRLPDSDFVKKYDALTDEMLSDFYDFLARMTRDAPLVGGESLTPIAAIMFSHWSRLFIELVRDEAVSIDAHVEQLRHDLTAMITLLESAL